MTACCREFESTCLKAFRTTHYAIMIENIMYSSQRWRKTMHFRRALLIIATQLCWKTVIKLVYCFIWLSDSKNCRDGGFLWNMFNLNFVLQMKELRLSGLYFLSQLIWYFKKKVKTWIFPGFKFRALTCLTPWKFYLKIVFNMEIQILFHR